jgi:hypothetical protein
MSFPTDSSEFERMSTKKLAILFGLAFFGAFLLIQMLQGFPLKDIIFREQATEEVQVMFKNEDVCIVEPSDQHPRDIHNCSYSVGDTLIITYPKNGAEINSHWLKTD